MGLATEGAIRGIETADDKEKNKTRLLRRMGSKNYKSSCLRSDIHNYLNLTGDHRVSFHQEPQTIIIPMKPLEEIMDWDGETPYDVLVVVTSSCQGGIAASGI